MGFQGIGYLCMTTTSVEWSGVVRRKSQTTSRSRRSGISLTPHLSIVIVATRPPSGQGSWSILWAASHSGPVSALSRNRRNPVSSSMILLNNLRVPWSPGDLTALPPMRSYRLTKFPQP